MAITTTLAACSTNPALNGPDGATDLPSSIDDAIRYALSFIAQLRDGGFAGWQVGMISPFATGTTPTGWLKLNGQWVSRTTYANLFAFAQTSGLISEAAWTAGQRGAFSVADGVTNFRLPDLRGMHTRGADEGSGWDPGRALFTFQDQGVLSHNHGVSDPGHGHSGAAVAAGSHGHSINDPGHNHLIPSNVWNGFPNGASSQAGGNIGVSSQFTDPATTSISINASGNHSHIVTVDANWTGISVQHAGNPQNTVRNISYPFYIKY